MKKIHGLNQNWNCYWSTQISMVMAIGTKFQASLIKQFHLKMLGKKNISSKGILEV